MFLIYRTLINIIFIISPIIILFRLFKKKEDLERCKEKFCFFSKKRVKGSIIWLHGASVGEIQSVIPLIEKFERDKKINQILVTSNTISSSKVLERINLKKTVHQFFPIDTNYLSKRFINYWKPSKVFFIDSEVWPNFLNNLEKRGIPTILLNARITKKSFNRWMMISNFAESIFEKFDICLCSSKETNRYLKKLGAKNIKFFGNLKFSQSENQIMNLNKDLKKIISSRKSWCASSTHFDEEKVCGIAHLKLKKKHKDILTIIIPRHINRVQSIKKDLKKLNLKVHIDEPKKKINSDIDVYLVNSYGKTKSFYKICKNVFLGGSLIPHGGQNPLEALRYGCKVLHGPNVSNFKEIYYFLKKRGLSNKVNNLNQLVTKLNKSLKEKIHSKKIIQNLNREGSNILEKTYKEVCKL